MIYERLREEVLRVMKDHNFSVEQLEKEIGPSDRELFVDVVRELVDEGLLVYDNAWRLKMGEGVR